MVGRLLREIVLGSCLRVCTFLVTLTTLLVLGCSRKEDGNSSTITFQIDRTLSQKVGALAVPSGYELGHIVINVQASDMEKVLWSWDADCGSQCYKLPPPDISLEVTSGSNRLIQYLGVYEDRTSGAKSLYFVYGDTTVTLYPGSQSVDLVASVYGGSSQIGKEVHVAGQYVESVENGVGKGPTGKVAVEFTPPNGRPTMTLFYSEIFNGWIELFGLEAIAFQYRLVSNNQILFSDVRTTSLDAQVSSKFLKVGVPQNYWIYEGSGSYRQGDGGTLYFGFFGPAVDKFSGKACYNESASTISYLYRDSTGTQPMNWSLSPSSMDVYLAGGGVAQSSCGQESEFSNKITFDPSSLRNGLWSASGFKGPFKRESQTFSISGGGCYDSSGSYASGCYDSTRSEYEIKWSYLPNAFANTGALSGVTLFMREEDTCSSGCSDHEIRSKNGDGYRCDELEYLGFVQVKDFGPTDPPTHRAAYTLGANRQLNSILCPYKNENGAKKYYTMGARVEGLYNYSYNSGGGSTTDGGTSKYLYFTGNTTTATDSCTSYTINTSASVSAATTISLSGAGSGAFYSGSSCSTGQTITSVSIPASTSSATFYYKTASSGTVYFAASATAGDTYFSSVQSYPVTVTGGNNAGGGTNTLGFTSPASSSMVSSGDSLTGSCDFNYSTLSIQIDANAATSIACTSGAWSTTFSVLTGFSSVTSSFTVSISQNGVTQYRNFTKSGGNSYTLSFSTLPSSITAGTCSGPYYISSSSNTTTATAIQVSQSSYGAYLTGSFYSTSDCSSTALTTISVSIPASTNTAGAFYYKNSTGSASSIKLNASVSTGDTRFASIVDFYRSIEVSGSLSFSGSQSISTNSCVAYSLYSSASVVATTTVALSAGLGSFYGDSTCTGTAITSVTFSTSSSGVGFYYKSGTAGATSFGATVSSGDPLSLANTYTVSIVSLGFTSPASSATVLALDTLSGYCDSAFSSVSVKIGTNTASTPSCASGAWSTGFSSLAGFSLMGVNGTFTVYITQNGVTLYRNFSRGSDGSLSMTISGSSLPSGSCSTAITLNSSIAVNSDTTISLSGAGVNGNFYSDSACSPGSIISSLTLLSGNSSASFYYQSTTPQCPSLQASRVSGDVLSSATVSMSVYQPSAVFEPSVIYSGGEASYAGQVKRDVYKTTDKGFTWSTVGCLPTPVYGHGMVHLTNELISIGGYSGSSFVSAVNVSTDGGATWSERSTLPASAGKMFAGVVVYKGAIYVIGGTNGSVVNTVFRSVDNGYTWTQESNLLMGVQSAGVAIHNFGDGSKIYLLGGMPNSGWSMTAYEFDGTSWQTLGTLPGAQAWTTAFSAFNKLWFIGGYSGTSVLDVINSYDGASWTTAGTPFNYTTFRTQFISLESEILALGQGAFSGSYGSEVLSSYDGLFWNSRGVLPEGRAGGAALAVTEPCPPNFLKVGGNVDLSTTSFCVAQYEMKDVSSVASSIPNGLPWTNINMSLAKSQCQALGAGFDLISNQEWMTIAREIESEPLNWSGGMVGTGKLSRGVAAITSWGDIWSNTAPLGSADNACLFNTGANSCLSTGTHDFKRTHELSEGGVIWDFSGNVNEWVDWYPPSCTAGTAGWYEFPGVTCGLASTHFQPLTSGANSFVNAGMVYLPVTAQTGAFRGGAFSSSYSAGIYSLNLGNSDTIADSTIGFRCVKRPAP